MILGTVVGTVVATAKHPAYLGHKLLLVRPRGTTGGLAGQAFIAVDNVQAGIGDHVLVLREGNGVRQLLGPQAGPIRSVIVGVVDAVDGAVAVTPAPTG